MVGVVGGGQLDGPGPLIAVSRLCVGCRGFRRARAVERWIWIRLGVVVGVGHRWRGEEWEGVRRVGGEWAVFRLVIMVRWFADLLVRGPARAGQAGEEGDRRQLELVGPAVKQPHNLVSLIGTVISLP